MGDHQDFCIEYRKLKSKMINCATYNSISDNMRYYKSKFPKEDEYVLVKLKRITEHNFVIVELLEYNNIEGMILLSEIHHRKMNVGKLFKDNIQICVVTDIDTDKMCVNLSYKKVPVEERTFFTNASIELEKLVNIFKEMQYLYDKHTNTKTDIIYKTVMWNTLNDQIPKRHLFEELNNIYKNILENPEQVLSNTDLPEDYKILCSVNIRNRVKCTDIQSALNFDLIVLDTDAINIIKDIMTTTPTDDWVYECVSSPKYRIVATSGSRDGVNEIMERAKHELHNKLKSVNSVFKLDESWVIVKEKTYTIKPLYMLD